MQTIIRLNPWLASILDVSSWTVSNTAREHPGEGGTLTIESSDVGTSYGILPDLIVADELVHWAGDGSLWHSLISSAAKRSNCLLVVISNAGFVDSWQWAVRETARTDEAWIFSRLDGPRASWMTPARLEEQRRMLPTVAYLRLWENQWSSGGGDALTEADIAAAFVPHLLPQTAAEPGYEYVCGVDAGVTRDASAVVVLGVRRSHVGHGRIRLAATKLWRPLKGQRVDLQVVEDALLDLHVRFRFRQINYDPWEMRHLASRLQSAGLGRFEGEPAYGKRRHTTLPMIEVPPTGKNLQALATAVIEAFNSRLLELYQDVDLRRDVSRFRVEERPYGFRLTSPHDELGHGDMGSAFALAVLAASELAAKKRPYASAYSGAPGKGRTTPLDAAWADLERRNRELQRLAATPDDPNEELRQFLRRY
jgi:hypothetical protein